MKKIIFSIIVFICMVLVFVFLYFFKKSEEPKPTFNGPIGQPSVRGPFGPPPAQ